MTSITASKKKGKPARDKSKCHRSYLYRVDDQSNIGKLQALDAVHAEWSRLLTTLGDEVWTEFTTGTFQPYLLGRASSNQLIKASPLQHSIKQCMCVAVEGALRSWASNLANRIAKLVLRNPRYAGIQHELLWLNRMQLWALPYESQVARLKDAQEAGHTELSSLSIQASNLLRRYFSKYLVCYNKPDFGSLPLQMNQLSASLAAPRTSSLSKVAYWLRLATLTKGSPVSIPIRNNAYAAQFEGEVKKTFTFTKRNGHWYLSVVKAIDVAEPREDGTEIAIDAGLRNRLATSDGVLYQVGFLTELEKWDAKYIKLVQGLQEAGIRRLKDCSRFSRFMRKYRSFLKSALLNSINKLVSIPLKTVVMERLSFFSADGRLSRKFNRLTRLMGYGIIKQGLTLKAQTQGFTLVEVNPAYSSQTCQCGFIHTLNRNKDSFRCKSCGCRAHADVNASRNLLERFKRGMALKGYYKEFRLKGLDAWATNLVALLKASPVSKSQGVIGNARIGLTLLDKKEDKAVFALSSINQLVSLSKCKLVKNLNKDLSGATHSKSLNKIPTLECT